MEIKVKTSVNFKAILGQSKRLFGVFVWIAQAENSGFNR